MDPAGVTACERILDHDECEVRYPVSDCGSGARESDDDERFDWIERDIALDVC